MRKLLLLIGCLLMVSMSAFAVVGSPFNAVATGNWNSGATWGNGGNVAGTDYPTTGQIATIGNGVLNPTVTIPASFSATITTLTISVGSTLTIASTGSLSLDGLLTIGDDTFGGFGYLNISGTLTANQGSSFATDSNLNTTIFSGGKYSHNFTTSAGNILQAAWNSGATCEVIGYTTNTTAPGFLNQSFHHFTWNCPNGPGSFISFAGTLGSIGGNFTVSATGTGAGTLRLFDSSSNGSLSVAGDIIVNGSGRLVLSSTGTGNTVTVAGNFLINNSITSTSTLVSSGSATLTVNGNFTMSPSASVILNFASTTGTGTINLLGNFSINSTSTLTSGSSGTANLNFTSSTVQSFANSSSTGSNVGKINFAISSLAILDVTTSIISGTGTFTLNGTLRVGSTDPLGPLQLNTTAGNLRVPTTLGSRVFNSGSTITYNGLGAQTIGDGHPTGSGITTRINNASGVSLSSNLVIVGTIILDNGNLSVGSNTLTMNGTFTPNSNSLVTTTNSNISIGGTGAFGTLALSGSTTINSFVLNRTASGTVTLGSALTIKNFGTFTQQAGNLILNGNILTISGDFTQSGGTITADAAATLIIDGSGTLPASISLSGTALNTLTIIRTTPTVAMAPNITVTNLNLTDGTLSNSGAINMANGGTVTVVAGAMTGTPVGGTSFNVVYNNTSALATGSELPTSTTALNNLTKSSGGTLTLSAAVTVTGTLTLNGAFDSNGKAIDIKGNVVFGVAPTFTASTVTFSGTTSFSGSAVPVFGAVTISATGTLTPSINYQINGNLINSGTLSNGTVTTTFGGTTTISGSSTSSFYNLTINGAGTLNAPAGNLNVAGTWSNSGTFNAGSGTVVFNGTSTIGGSSSTTFGNIQITSTLTAPSVMVVSGNFANNGTFNNNAGTVTFTGTGAQSITGVSTTFNNINANNPFGTGVNTTVRLDGVLTLNASGAFDADGSGSGVFIVSSTGQTTGGMIATLPAPTNFSGQVTVERFIHSQSGGDYRFLSMPITNGNLSLWKSSIFVTGNFSDRSTNADNANITDSGNTSPSVFTWDITTQAYVGLTAGGGTTSSVAISSRTGYAAYDFNNGSVTASYRGPIETGTVPITISSTNNNFNLVPNPYPSPIDWDNVTKTNVNNAMWLRAANNIYSSYVGGVVTNSPFGGWTGEIATGQSFWTQSNGVGASLSLKEGDKTSNSYKFLRVQSPENIVRIQLKSSNQQDEAVIHFVDKATDGIDSEFDAVKKRNGNYVSALGQNNYLNISSYNTSPSVDYAINSIDKISKGTKLINLKVGDVKPGNHSLKITDISTFSLGYTITLIDNFLNQEKNVTDNFVYDFSITQNAQSFGDSRFVLRFGKAEVITGLGDIGTNSTISYPNPVDSKLFIKLSPEDEANLRSMVLYDVMGNAVISSERDKQLLTPGLKTIDMSDYASGFYILNIHSGNEVKSIKVIKK